MKLQLVKGSTSVILTVFIQDSSSGVGAGLGSLDESSSIVGGYVRMGGTGVALAVDENVTTEGTYQAPSAAGKVRIGTPANMRTGVYELHLHDDLLSIGSYVLISLGGATNMADLIIEIQLTDVDLNDADHCGITVLGEITPTRMAVLTDWINGGRLDLLLDAIKAVTDALPDAGALTTIGTDTARLTAVRAAVLTDWINGGRLDLLLDAALADTNELQADWANGGRLDLLLDAILADTGTDGVVLANNAITAAKIATDAIGSAEVSAAAANKIADHKIRRSFENACDSSDGDTKSFRSELGAMAKLVNKVVISGGVLTAYEDDDATTLGSQTITTDDNAIPIVGVDTD